MSFLEILQDHTVDMESPTSYIIWSGLGAIAAVLRDNVFFQFRHGRIYPNIYVILVAKSSATRKDPPVRLIEKLVREVGNTKVVAGRASIQGIMRTLYENYTNEKNHRLKGASGIFISKELSDFLVEDPVATKILTDWYDTHDVWDNNLITLGGINRLENVCVTMVAASNDVLFTDVFKSSEIYGGLLARTFIITETKRRRKDSRMYDENKTIVDKMPELIKHLHSLTKFKGSINIHNDARAYYDDWYKSIDDESFDKAGIVARIHTGVLKVAILIAANRFNFNMEMTLKDMEHATDLCTGILKNYKQIVFTGGKNEAAAPTGLILAELLKSKDNCLQRRHLIQRLLSITDSVLIDKSLATLQEAEYVVVTQREGSVAYQLTPKCIEIYNKECEATSKGKSKGITV